MREKIEDIYKKQCIVNVLKININDSILISLQIQYIFSITNSLKHNILNCF